MAIARAVRRGPARVVGDEAVAALGIQVFKEMVHLKSKDNLSPARVEASCDTGSSYIGLPTIVKWFGCAALG